MREVSGLQLRALEERDVPAVVAIHSQSFPDSAQTRLGPRYLARFYRVAIDDPGHVALVAVSPTGEIVGFVVGSLGRDAALRRLWWRPSVWSALGRQVVFSRHPYREIRSMAQAARTAIFRGRARTQFISPVQTRLVSHAVHPAHRGSGIASAYLTEFRSQLAKRGVAQVGASVRQTNVPAMRALLRDGWWIEHESAGTSYFVAETSGLAPHKR